MSFATSGWAMRVYMNPSNPSNAHPSHAAVKASICGFVSFVDPTASICFGELYQEWTVYSIRRLGF
jgi:hypothetical protein